MKRVLTYILAGGKGERLNPLTKDRAKPAVPFGGIYRIIDVTLSNCINSGLRRIYLLTQYKSFSLQKHVTAGWWDIVSSQLGEFIDLVPAQQRISADWYQGTADAIFQNIYTIHDHTPDLILILAGDHVYKMDYQDMIDEHCRRGADVTVCGIPMPAETSRSFGVLEVDDQARICGFQEKPEQPRTIPGSPDKIFASMGVYLFKADALCEELAIDAKNAGSAHDFGKNIIPQMLERNRKVYVHDFVDETGGPAYWRDIGTRDAYYEANLDLISPDPGFDIYDRKWPLRTNHIQHPPIKALTFTDENGQDQGGTIENSMVAGGCILTGAHVRGSLLSPNVRLAPRTEVDRSILMHGVQVGEGARIRNAIIDKDNIIPAGEQIGYDLERDRERYDVTASGIVIVAKKQRQ
ncbi:MAG: glucose-1-phosphate adenylyltransferase [Candidatus Omnitrophota bacterium]